VSGEGVIARHRTRQRPLTWLMPRASAVRVGTPVRSIVAKNHQRRVPQHPAGGRPPLQGSVIRTTGPDGTLACLRQRPPAGQGPQLAGHAGIHTRAPFALEIDGRGPDPGVLGLPVMPRAAHVAYRHRLGIQEPPPTRPGVSIERPDTSTRQLHVGHVSVYFHKDSGTFEDAVPLGWQPGPLAV
jgi:hypothetical protein